MISRRDYLQLAALAGVSLAAAPKALLAAEGGQRALITRTIPGTSERLPVIGLGSSASFSRIAGAGETAVIQKLLEHLAKIPNSVFDTAPSYGASEEVAAGVARTSGVNQKLFWATKVNVAGFGGSHADPKAARAQLDRSIERLGKTPVDLIQVHNMGDVPTQLGLLKEYQKAGRVRYVGVTTTFPQHYEQLERVMREHELNFIGVDYAIDNRVMEERIFPLAQQRNIGVLAYQPFGRDRLWQKVKGHTVPEWAAEYDIATWGQFFLKFAISHPAVTVATPATSNERNLIDNLGAATGRLPDEKGRQRMIAHVESL
ncbi:aldo/keto reductase [Ottowia thiooxydans]|uniref:Aryl-alcohol dehydrogenase-like predicted oxidoreductase n=1 Tax=Ottowia thiooxydans TaxID=219182 RepID=A0ABV2QCL7_9BURK